MKFASVLLVPFSFYCCLGQVSAQVDSSNVDVNALPNVADGFGVNIVAKEPHFINPAALAFDKKGRLFVGAGPQYRKPSPDTPGDYIKILIDQDEDGVVDEVKTFAEGFNNVQALAWKGDELWVANCPDVTVLRDTDGDDVADEYELIFTGLGHLRHGLHGFNWGPDGRLYMTQGNSRVQEHAPMAFRKLMRVKSDKPDNQPLNQVFTRETYKKSYIGGWPSAEGGILRCEAGGKNLEIFTRGLRNSWDMAMDTSFNWVATDNDPGPQHDRIFMPFQGAHFGMSHPWSFDWMAKDHLPTAPSISKLPTVSGSGVGVVYYTHSHFPEKYQNSFLIGDWTNKRIYHFPTTWDGAHMKSADVFETLADAGRTQAGDLGYKPKEGKSLFRPTDIAVAPSGALYIAGWGAHYGSIYASFGGADSKAKKNYGRVFRLFHKERPLLERKDWLTANRNKPHSKWTFEELLEDLGEQIPAWRVNAQDELIGRGAKHRPDLIKAIESGNLSEGQETWAAWTLGRMAGWPSDAKFSFGKWSEPSSNASLNLRVQSVRIWGESGEIEAYKYVAARLDDKEPRVRFAAALALRKLKEELEPGAEKPLLDALAAETDRVTFYAQWHTLREMLTVEERRKYLADKRGGVRLGALLSLLEEDALDKTEVNELGLDPDERVAGIAQSWLKKNGGGVLPGVTIDAPRRNFRDPVAVSLASTVKGYEIRYTLDGSEPSAKSNHYGKPLKVSEDLTIRTALFRDGKRRSSIAQAGFHRVSDAEWNDRVFLQDLKVKSGQKYEIVEMGLQPGAKVFIDREYTYSSIPPEVQGLTFIRTANNDAKSTGDNLVQFEVNIPAAIYVAHDERLGKKPKWMSEYQRTDLVLNTSDVPFRLYRLDVLGGPVVLGGNVESGNRSSMYQVIVQRPTAGGKVNAPTVHAILKSGKADKAHGSEVFFGKGACMACHRIQGKGQNLGPDLSDLGLRAQADYVVRAILEPSADIIEGYQQAHFEMKDGSEVFGMVQGETAKSVKVFLADGSPRDVSKPDIKKRTMLEISGMPPSYAYSLTTQEIADLAGWLLDQRTPLKKQ